MAINSIIADSSYDGSNQESIGRASGALRSHGSVAVRTRLDTPLLAGLGVPFGIRCGGTRYHRVPHEMGSGASRATNLRWSDRGEVVKVSTTAASVILRGARNAVRRAGHSAAAPQTGHATCPPCVGSNASVAPPDYYFFLVHKPARCEPAAAGLGRTRTPHPALQGFAFFSAQLQKRNRSSQRHRHLPCTLDAEKPKLIQHIHDSKHSRFVCSQNQSEIHAWILAVQIAHAMFRESTTTP